MTKTRPKAAAVAAVRFVAREAKDWHLSAAADLRTEIQAACRF
jgi:hypothetical protein